MLTYSFATAGGSASYFMKTLKKIVIDFYNLVGLQFYVKRDARRVKYRYNKPLHEITGVYS